MDSTVIKVSYKRVKIAILDSGIASKHFPPKLVVDNCDRFVDCKSFEGSGVWDEDIDGHGTHTAILLLQVCPNAEVSILRVVRKQTDVLQSKAVSEAIIHAVDSGADIISMSLGWIYGHTDVEKALLYAAQHNVLVFAATSNDGIRHPTAVAFPARAYNVISVDSASGDGKPSSFNPPANDDTNNKGDRFTAPGEEVLSAFPLELENTGIKRMTGTSFATPIAAGVAALVLEFCRQLPLGQHSSVVDNMKKIDVMRKFLQKECSVRRRPGEPFLFLCPWYILSSGDQQSAPYGGAHDQSGSPRFAVASKILLFLRTMVDPEIAT